MPRHSEASPRIRRLLDTDRSIGGNVTAMLRDAIIRGDLQPGDRLGQEELSAEFGVSQAPVREALRRLESEGLVEHQPNRGGFVLRLSHDELLNVVAPVRVVVETYAIGVALKKDREALVTGLESIVAGMRKAARARDLETVNDLDVEFHGLAIELCGEPHTRQLWRSIMPRLRAEFTRLAPNHSMREIIDDHQAILDAIAAGGRTKIERAIHGHAVVRTKELLDRAPAVASSRRVSS